MAYIKLEDLQKFPIRIDHYDKENGDEHFVFGVETVLEYAEHLPKYSVSDNEVVKHGEWIKDNTIPFVFGGIRKCSLCGYDERIGTTVVGSRYCPHCGAKMDGGEVHNETN